MNRTIIWMVVITLLLSACAPKAEAPEAVHHFTLVPIEGTEFNTITLTEKAAERLDIQLAVVREETVTQKQSYAGTVVQSPLFESDAPAPSASVEGSVAPVVLEPSAPTTFTELWVRVPLIKSELEELNRDEAALIFPLGDANATGLSVTEKNVDGLALDNLNPDISQETSLYFNLEGSNHNFGPGQRVLVELTKQGNGTQKKVVPFGALIYGLHGETWVYTNAEPLTYVRVPVVIDFIDGDNVVFSEGPEVGASIVIVGAAMLYGAESGVGGGH